MPLVSEADAWSIRRGTRSSRSGSTTPTTPTCMGIYSASKHAMEAIAETMKLELQEFGVAIVNRVPS